MDRETIDFGIDLGTTNSSVAMWHTDGRIETFKNLEQAQCTPSVVYEDRKGKIHVGNRAKEATQVKGEASSVFFEFKQKMGRSTTYTFPRSGQVLKPEELSAEVLKSLKVDVRRRLNEDLHAAVITIPAAFDRSEINATNKAAKLAGFTASPLCLEPVAAALAYGHQNASQNGFWLVFDFGGGTFDAAIVQLKDEEFQIVNHQGDNHLGGKLIDWAILDQMLIPAVQKEFNLPGFSRESDDPIIKMAILRLKHAVEKAKICLSSESEAEISIDNILVSPSGENLYFDYELKRSEVNRMAEPYILRAVSLCREALKEKRLTPQDMDRLILVGGPTQMPIFREMLADKNVGLGIPLEYSVDPMTVVAQGAAIFARTQKLGLQKAIKPVSGEIGLELDYEPAGADEEPLVSGKLIPEDGASLSGFTIEFYKSDWRSGKIRITSDGTFMTQLVAERNENIYSIEVQDDRGNVCKVSRKQITYLRKAMFREIPLTHSIAVAKADNSVDPIFEKGIGLPLKKMRTYTQTVEVKRGDTESAIRIPLIEGSHMRADRNIPIGYLVIGSDEIKRDVPAGSEIEFTLSVNESNELTAMAYIPVLGDQEFKTTIDLEKPEVDKKRIYSDAKAEIRRLNALEEQVNEVEEDKAKSSLSKIKSQRMLEEVEGALTLLDKDGDGEDLLVNRLRELKLGLDEVETALEWPTLLKEADKSKADVEKLMNESEHINNDDKSTFARLCKEYQSALKAEEADLLRRTTEEFDELYYTIQRKNPTWWVAVFEHQRGLRSKMTDQALANDLFAQGHRSIDNNDVDGLKSAVGQLWRLLPREEVARAPGGFGSTVN